jgi:hypothetical protein
MARALCAVQVEKWMMEVVEKAANEARDTMDNSDDAEAMEAAAEKIRAEDEVKKEKKKLEEKRKKAADDQVTERAARKAQADAAGPVWKVDVAAVAAEAQAALVSSARAHTQCLRCPLHSCALLTVACLVACAHSACTLHCSPLQPSPLLTVACARCVV